MTQDAILEKLLPLVADRFQTAEDSLSGQTAFQKDLGADSLDLVEMVMELEDEFGVQISDEAAETIVTLEDAAAYIAKQLEN